MITQKTFLIRYLLISFIFHILAGIFSTGFYDMDEHFQILEFINFHLGRSPAQDLPWEFHHQIRPWFQPLFYESFIRLSIYFGIKSPASWAMIIRLFSSLMGWLTVVALSVCSLKWFKSSYWQKTALISLNLFWCLPYFHARTSSENLSSSFFWLGVATTLVFLPYPRSILSGVFLGLAFECRFQMAFAIGTFFIYQCVQSVGVQPVDVRKSIRLQFLFLLSFLCTVGLGTLLDCYGYQNWTFTPWNYFYENIVLGKAAGFGVQPWSYYFEDIVQALPPLGAILLGLSICAWIFMPLHLLTLITFTFVAAHSLLSHKEERFLYPLLPAFPLLATLGFQKLSEFIKTHFGSHVWPHYLSKVFCKPLIYLLLLENLIALIIGCLKPSSAQPTFYDAVFNQSPPIQELYFIGQNPYHVGGNTIHFYRNSNLNLHPLRLGNISALPQDHDFWLYYDQFDLPAESGPLKEQCKRVFTVFPRWLHFFTFLPGPAKSASRWSLYQCHPIKPNTTSVAASGRKN